MAVQPKLSSVFPSGGQRGSRFEVEIRGQHLDQSYAVWFSGSNIKASIKGVEVIESKISSKKEHFEDGEDFFPDYRVWLQVEIDSVASVGTHRLRLVSPRGISNSLGFIVHPHPVISESEFQSKSNQSESPNIPIVISGKIGQCNR